MRHIKFKRKVFEEAALVSHLTYQIGESPLLRQKSEDVEVFEIKSKRIQNLISKLKSTLKKYRKLTKKGRGVAAVQIGVSLKIAVVFEENKLMTIINPRILRKSKRLFKYPEICMSANPIIAKVTRPSYIEFEYLDENGIKLEWRDQESKILNRVFQHEIDHMEGIINIDLVDSRDLIMLSDSKFFKNAEFEEVK
jgi:peptide deformylase